MFILLLKESVLLKFEAKQVETIFINIESLRLLFKFKTKLRNQSLKLKLRVLFKVKAF